MKRTRTLIALVFLVSLAVSTTACKTRKGGKKGCNCPTWQKPAR